MAIIYTYPEITTITGKDRLIISETNTPGNPTKSISINNLRSYLGSLGTVTSVGLTMPSAFSVVGSPVTTAGVFAVTGSGTVNDYIDGTGALQLFPTIPTGGPFLPLTAGNTVPLTGDLYMAPTGAGPSVGSNVIVFRGVDDLGTELDAARIFTLDSTINPSGQDLYFQNADDNGVLRTGLFIDAFQQIAIAKGTATAQLDVGGNGNFDTTLVVGTTLTVGTDVTFSSYGAGTQTGTATFNLEVDANGNVIETASGSGVTSIIAGTNVTISPVGGTGDVTINASGGGGGIGGTGTIDTLPVFTAATTLGDSIYVQNAGAAIGTINGERLVLGDGTATTVDFLINTTGVAGDTVEIQSQGIQFMLHEKGADMRIGPSDDIIIDESGTGITMLPPTTFDSDIIDKNGVTGNNGFILASNGGGGAGIEWVQGYSAFQTFVWTNGSPVAYTNWLSATSSFLPFDATPLISVSNLPGGTLSNYAWTCVNAAGGTAGQFATFTLGAFGAGTWKIRTCQHWFDQTSQVEMRVSLDGTATGGTKIDVIDQKSTELSGDKIFYGELVQVCGAGDTILVDVEFTVGGVNPFPSDSGNRPIEVTFERIV